MRLAVSVLCWTLLAACCKSTVTITGAAKAKVWPNCIVRNYTLRHPKPVFADLRKFITHQVATRHREVVYNSEGVIGMVLKMEPHQLGEVVEDVLAGSQAADAGVQKGWIIVEINGKKFTANERLADVAADFAKAKDANSFLTVRYDVTSYFDCVNRDCTKSDRFPADSLEQCAEACDQVAECQWWNYGSVDGDAICMLQSSTNGSFKASPGANTAPQGCIPRPQVLEMRSEVWPKCIVHDAAATGKGGEPCFADVRPFITHADAVRHRLVTFESKENIGMILRDKPHDDGEIVDSVQVGSQAALAGVQKGWIIKEVDLKPFSKAQDLARVSALFSDAKQYGPTVLVKFDIRTSVDCADGNCSRSDKLPAGSEAFCADTCSQIPDCTWWSFGQEEEDQMCWLRKSGQGLKAAIGSSSGERSCTPPRSSWYRFVFLFGFVIAIIYNRELLVGKLSACSLPNGFRTTDKRLGYSAALQHDFEGPGAEMSRVVIHDDDF